ncbi:hypothetical protein B0T22DRAFT_176571 [Podospora appendiculata]|uniref:Uncharacterized protein n=1 Tax=Podospora appendiculata TaxID=314037 RepID=A0AAE0XBY7_9PEZI|nr:hypothetical protein B0T22DRAFT_176571 [Podospora appendiculata]
MGLFKKTCYTGILTAASFLGYVGATTTIIAPLPKDDAIWSSRSYLQGNIHQNPPTQDVCLKRVPLDKIRPELLRKEGDLALELCRGIWSGLAFRIQRAYLARKYQGTATAIQLWTVDQLSSSTYEPGTQLTDHFEVLDKTPTETILRAGDSPRNSGPRGSDGLLVISAVIDQERREVVLGLKSCFFGSDRKVEDSQGPMPRWMEEMHRWYSRLLITAASWRVTR